MIENEHQVVVFISMALVAIFLTCAICLSAWCAMKGISDFLVRAGALIEHIKGRFARSHGLRRAKDRCLDLLLDGLGLCGAALFIAGMSAVIITSLVIVAPVCLLWLALSAAKKYSQIPKCKKEKLE